MDKLFRYSNKDAFLILYAVVMFFIPIVLAFYTPSIFWLLVITFFYIWFLVNGQNSSEHHHTHWPTFVKDKYNKIYDIFLSLTFGIPATLWRYSHTLHHKHVNDKPVDGKCLDPVSVYILNPEKGELNNFWVYCFKFAYIGNIKPLIFWYKLSHLQLKKELWAFRLYVLAVFVINPFIGAWLFASFCLSFVVNNANSYGEHWGALNRRGDTTQDSIGIYSKWYNIFGFNAGLHQEHHHRPGTHWTLLPTVTPLLHPNRVIKKHGVHITNNPFWEHFVLLIKRKPAVPK
jgi:fatty acid desaturase